MVIRHTNRGHFRHFKVASRSLSSLLRTLFLQDLVSCLSKDQREFGPQSGEREEEEEEEDQAKETTQKAGTAKRRESSPLGTADRPHTVDHI